MDDQEKHKMSNMGSTTGYCYSDDQFDSNPADQIYSTIGGFPIPPDHHQSTALVWQDHQDHDGHDPIRSLPFDDSSLRCVFPCEGNERPSQGLSLSLSSTNPSTIGLQSFELRQQQQQQNQENPDHEMIRFCAPSSRSDHGLFGKSVMGDGYLGKPGNLHQFVQIRNSKHRGPAQELLNEVCNPSGGPAKLFSDQELKNKSLFTNNNSTCSNIEALELQKRKAKLFSMLEEVDRRYRNYRDQMKEVVASFEAVAGHGAAGVYSALASKAMSRHFRCLRDGIVGQIKATKTALGEKDAAAPGASRGETPRLRLLDQTLRQQRAIQQMSLMESHPWRPQRGLPERSVSVLRAWLFEHFLHPYPSDVDKHILARQTGLSRSQVSNWFINARVRLWKPMVEEIYEETKEQKNNNMGLGASSSDDMNIRPNQNSMTRTEDKKSTPDQLVGMNSECLSTIVNNPETSDTKHMMSKSPPNPPPHHDQPPQRLSFGRVGDTFGAIELDFSSYNQTPLMEPNGWTLQPPSSSSNIESASCTASEGGDLLMEDLADEVSQSSDQELLEEISLKKLEETPSDPQDLEDLNCDPTEVPSTSSHHFSILHMLDLSYTEIKSLPQSISRLAALQKLFLRNCALLTELPPEIGELTNLEVLDLEGTEILCLPKEIAKLVNLTRLKVSFYGYANQTVIPRRVLSNLSRLNELIIDVTPYGEWWDVQVEAIIDDLCSLKELRTLKLYLPTAELLEKLTVIFPGLTNFRFTVGLFEEHFISRLPRDVEDEFNNREKLEKGLKFINGNCIPNEITKVLQHANAFFLQRHWTAESLFEFGHENLNEVKFFLVMECNEYRTIIDSEKFYQGKDGRDESEAIVLGSLERLIIRYMKNMVSFWKGPVGKGSLTNLKFLALHTCPNLTTLFTFDMLNNLRNLEELIVEDCPKIKSLVSLKSSGPKSDVFLPSLKKISLLELPELVGISNGLRIAPVLERMIIFYCPKLGKLSTTEVSSTKLKVVKGEKEWWDALKWYESDLSTEYEDYLARLFIPLRRDGDLMAQLTED